MRRHAIEESGYDGMAIKRWNKSTHEVIGNREECGIQKVQGEPQRRGLCAPAEGGFTTQQAGRDRLQNRNGLCSTSNGGERYGIKYVEHSNNQPAQEYRLEGVRRRQGGVGIRAGVIAHGLSSLQLSGIRVGRL